MNGDYCAHGRLQLGLTLEDYGALVYTSSPMVLMPTSDASNHLLQVINAETSSVRNVHVQTGG